MTAKGSDSVLRENQTTEIEQLADTPDSVDGKRERENWSA